MSATKKLNVKSKPSIETLKQLLIEHEKEQEVVLVDVIACGFLSSFSLRLGLCSLY